MKYPLGIQTFADIREGDFVYVDKTAIIYDLISAGKAWFLSRPRRFGKSLLISTFEALFAGKRSLFTGLAIDKSDYDFASYPVIKLEFSKDKIDTPELFINYIETVIDDIASRHNISLKDNTFNLKFNELVVKLSEVSNSQVVLLIDEYDKPIIDNILSDSLVEIKAVMNGFYAMLKSLDEHLKFTFITGVSKFAKVSVFSGMNNLTDISVDEAYATICGITEQEKQHYFDDVIVQLAERAEHSEQQLQAKIKYWYNGYRFEEDSQSVYNPYSLLSFLSKRKFKNYWYTTATPTFLLDILQQKQFDLTQLSAFEIGESAFAATEPEELDVLSLLVQTGYLTIKGYNEPLYVLDFPNYEVKRSFFDSIVARYAKLNTGVGQAYTVNLIKQINAGELEAFFNTLREFFANIPYVLAIEQEKYYQALFYAIFTLLGFEIQAEVYTNKGRIDCVLQTADSIYIIEFKLNDSKEAALQQIIDKDYAQKYRSQDKEIVLLGVEFDSEARNIGDFVVQKG